jgi:hypothetical protein
MIKANWVCNTTKFAFKKTNEFQTTGLLSNLALNKHTPVLNDMYYLLCTVIAHEINRDYLGKPLTSDSCELFYHLIAIFDTECDI